MGDWLSDKDVLSKTLWMLGYSRDTVMNIKYLNDSANEYSLRRKRGNIKNFIIIPHAEVDINNQAYFDEYAFYVNNENIEKIKGMEHILLRKFCELGYNESVVGFIEDLVERIPSYIDNKLDEVIEDFIITPCFKFNWIGDYEIRIKEKEEALLKGMPKELNSFFEKSDLLENRLH